MSELPGISGTADTALSALPQLHDEGFINVDAICGRQNSREVRLEVSLTPRLSCAACCSHSFQHKYLSAVPRRRPIYQSSPIDRSGTDLPAIVYYSKRVRFLVVTGGRA